MKQVPNHTTHNYHLCKHNRFGTESTQVTTRGRRGQRQGNGLI